jgi:hypothetical protein
MMWMNLSSARGVKRVRILTALALAAIAVTHLTAPHHDAADTGDRPHHPRVQSSAAAAAAAALSSSGSSENSHDTRTAVVGAEDEGEGEGDGRVALGADGLPLDSESGWDDAGVARGGTSETGYNNNAVRHGQRRRGNATNGNTTGEDEEDAEDDYGEALRAAKSRGAYYNCALTKAEKPGLNQRLVYPPALADPNMLFVNRANHAMLLKGENQLPPRWGSAG